MEASLQSERELVAQARERVAALEAEMKAMVDSSSPGGAESASMSVTKPHLYFSLNRFLSRAVSSSTGLELLNSVPPPGSESATAFLWSEMMFS